MDILATLIIGGLAGWIGGLILRGRGCGCFGNILVGIIGGYVGLFIFRLLGFRVNGNWDFLIASIIGSIILLALAGFTRRR